jgi:hypothetical protein
MPRFFFHARSGDGLTRDHEGQDLPNREAAHAEALAAAEQLWGDLPPDVAREDLSLEVADETGAAILTVPFAEAAERFAKGSGEPLNGSGAT